MNKFNQILISATVGSIVTLAATMSPLLAQSQTTTPAPAHPPAGMQNHQQMMNDMAEMMEKCRSMMGNHGQSAEHQPNKPANGEHQQHQPNHNNSTTPNQSKSEV